MGSKVRREEERKPSHLKRGRGACACVRVCARNNSGASAGPTRLSLIITLFLSIALPFLPPFRHPLFSEDMALARGEERIAAFVLCMKLSREAQDACFIPLLFLFFILISIFLYFFTWGGASLHLLVSTLFPKLPFFSSFASFSFSPTSLLLTCFPVDGRSLSLRLIACF